MNPGYMRLTGNPVVTFDQARVYTNPVNTTPPAIDIRDFNGAATLIGLDLQDRIILSGSGAGSLLALGLQGHSSRYFTNNTSADARLINSRWLDTVAGSSTAGTNAVPNVGAADITFLRNMLSQTRGTNLSNEYESFPSGITDVRMYRVYVERAIVGIQIKR
jgi:hypothetical protein